MNNSDALFCLGAMYENGQGGLTMNKTKAFELYVLAAAVTRPSTSAMCALGNYYLSGSKEVTLLNYIIITKIIQNRTLAKIYFEKAAKLQNADAFHR